MTNLKYLDLSHNNFKGFKDDQFGRNNQLKRIKMDHNYLKSLPDKVFGECRNLGKNNSFHICTDFCVISFRICLRFPLNSKLRRRKDIPNPENVGKFNMNHLSIHINRREILR